MAHVGQQKAGPVPRHDARDFVLPDLPIANLLFGDRRLAWLWLPLRPYLGSSWLEFGLKKLAEPRWTQTGEYLRGFWEKAVQVLAPPARPPIVIDWYRDFIAFMLHGGHHAWFAKLIVFGELTIGIAPLLGAFTGMAVFFRFMNWNFVMAGTASSNGLPFAMATWLVLAWKMAGWIGLDRWLLPLLGTPWRAGRLFARPAARPAEETA
jgi:thiosulfate dehydrogenase [quinone] large subunit